MNEFEEFAFEVKFMNCEVDRSQDLRVIKSDENFERFVGASSNIKNGDFRLLNIIDKRDREIVKNHLCKKSEYVQFDFCITGASGETNLVHCSAQRVPGTKINRLTIADISQSEKKTERLKKRADALGSLIDVVKVGICLFKVNRDMHFEAIYVNNGCCQLFGTEKERLNDKAYRIDELIHPDDKSSVFQAIGTSMATKKPIDLVLRVITHKDSYIRCKFNAEINRYEEDGCPVFHATFTDVTGVTDQENIFYITQNV